MKIIWRLISLGVFGTGLTVVANAVRVKHLGSKPSRYVKSSGTPQDGVSHSKVHQTERAGQETGA